MTSPSFQVQYLSSAPVFLLFALFFSSFPLPHSLDPELSLLTHHGDYPRQRFFLTARGLIFFLFHPAYCFCSSLPNFEAFALEVSSCVSPLVSLQS